MRSVACLVALAVGIGAWCGPSSAQDEASSSADCPPVPLSQPLRVLVATGLFDVPRGTVVAQAEPGRTYAQTSALTWLDGTDWLLLADPRDGKPIGWVASGSHVQTVLDLLLYSFSDKGHRVDLPLILRGKLP